MIFDFGFKSSLLLFFFFHGLVFSALLLIKGIQNESRAARWLGFFTILSSLYIAPFMLGYAGWYSKASYRDILFYVPFQQLFLLPPVLYLYVRSLLDKSFVFSKKELVHFVPAGLYFLYSLIVFTVDKIAPGELFFYNDGKDKDFSTWYQVAGFIMLAFYLTLSLKTYRKYKRITYDVISFADSVMFKWAQRFLIAFLLLLTIRGLFFVLNPEWDEFGKKFWYYVCFSMLFYYISISGYTNTVRSLISFKDSPFIPVADVVPDHEQPIQTNPLLLSATAQNAADKQKETIPDLVAWITAIKQLMLVNKLYENPELTLADVSFHLGTHPKKVSQVINQGFHMNFNDFVNHYRAKAVIQKIEEGEHTVQTLLSIGFECGFNSKSTFNRAFKRYTSFTPKEYIEKHRS
jgi:AraC-like DNA-binding protein